jgi:hypothetical protein
MLTKGDHAMVDALGWRIKFGVIAPSTTAVQPEFDAMRLLWPNGRTSARRRP